MNQNHKETADVPTGMHANGCSICIRWVYCGAHSGRPTKGQLVQMACQHVQHMHRALTQMNLEIHHVIDGITGLTGLAIVDAILGGHGTRLSLPSSGISELKPTRRRSAGRWWALGGTSTYLR